eukprot:GDKI01005089.1.p1 GENE.GDKI01005089.1~~GDKI01005089.1.p1  ORF type:complete len:550 (-),score=103.67 GDKI01005089.1:31-1635(-)
MHSQQQPKTSLPSGSCPHTTAPGPMLNAAVHVVRGGSGRTTPNGRRRSGSSHRSQSPAVHTPRSAVSPLDFRGDPCELPEYYPHCPPLYDTNKTWMENVKLGPQFRLNTPLDSFILNRPAPPKEEWVSLLGGMHKVMSPIGIPAGPLLDSNWTTLASRLGFDIVTYKTIRSSFRDAHALPNSMFLEEDSMDLEHGMYRIEKKIDTPEDMSRMSLTSSYGMPSMSPEYLQDDIMKARHTMREGQLLIVSVVGTPSDLEDPAHKRQALVEDYVHTAKFAADAGAMCVELNLSCPNVDKSTGEMYQNAEFVYNVCHSVVRELEPKHVPVSVKVGDFGVSKHNLYEPIFSPETHTPLPGSIEHSIKQILESIARAGAKGVCGINSPPMQVFEPSIRHTPRDGDGVSHEDAETRFGRNAHVEIESRTRSHHLAMGTTRPTAGVCGSAIKPFGVAWARGVDSIRKREKIDLTLFACGGVTQPEDFDAYIQAGADVAMSACAFWYDPLLALRWHFRKPCACLMGTQHTVLEPITEGVVTDK